MENLMKLHEYDEPKTIEEAITILDDYFNYSWPKEKDYFNNSTSSDIVYEYHHGFGQKIRNAWLWPKNPNIYSEIYKLLFDLGIEHPDNMSSFLLRVFWYYKHEPEKSIEQHKQRLLNEMIIKNII